MATASKNTNTYNRQNWETSDFPILCETCLGENPYVRMTKEKYGRECKICERPFTVFRWKPGAKMRFKKTEICQTCAKLKNVCQTCLLDLEYGLPTQVRDAALGLTDDTPMSDVNREYHTQNQEALLGANGGLTPVGQLANAGINSGAGAARGHELLLKLARKKPYYKRNRAHICSFWVKGECKRGEECPYRHEMPLDPNGPLAQQNMKDRYYGHNDPVANKMLERSNKTKALETPVDKSIMNLFVGGVEAPFVTEQDLRDYFYQFGELRVINVLKKSKAAIVHFTSRDAAEKAASSSHNSLVIKGRKLKVLWGRNKQQNPNRGAPPPAVGGGAASGDSLAHIGAPPTGGFVMPPAPPGMTGAPGGGGRRGLYPSQDPQRMGARSANPMPGAHQQGPAGRR